jgi:hypothetical protein
VLRERIELSTSPLPRECLVFVRLRCGLRRFDNTLIFISFALHVFEIDCFGLRDCGSYLVARNEIATENERLPRDYS